MQEKIKEKFEEDFSIVATKFFLLLANITLIRGEYKEAEVASQTGQEHA